MVSQILFLRILNFFNRFAACFDLLKTDFLFKNQNVQKKCQHNHLFVLKKLNIFTKKLITNRQFRIHVNKIREKIWWADHWFRNWRNNEYLSLQITCIEFRSRGCNNKYLVSHKQSVEDFKSKHYSLEAKGLLCEKENQVRASYQYNWNELPSKCCIRNDSTLH